MHTNWQEITHNWPADEGPAFRLARAKVPGGWLVIFFELRVEEYDINSPARAGIWGAGFGGMTFLPDLGHSWDGNSLP
jgi:hypothetical protein